MISKHAENFRKYFKITDEDRKRMTPEEIERLEKWAEEMMESVEPTTEFNERKFDASDAVLANMKQAKKESESGER